MNLHNPFEESLIWFSPLADGATVDYSRVDKLLASIKRCVGNFISCILIRIFVDGFTSHNVLTDIYNSVNIRTVRGFK